MSALFKCYFISSLCFQSELILSFFMAIESHGRKSFTEK